jgi:glycosyltransferase involved in cell wall biosynthesis
MNEAFTDVKVYRPNLLSIVIPVYNEEESLAPLIQEIDTVATQENLEVEIIFIDDGSIDSSWKIIQGLAAKDARIQAIRFRRNFGKAAALAAGFKLVRGEVTMTLDADLQDDPIEIPRFLHELSKDLDVVSGWKKIRHDPWHKVIPSRIFNGLVSRLTGVKLHDHNCGMKCYRSEVLKEVRLYGELHRFIPVLAAAKGFRVGELVIRHRPRKFGSSKYGVKRFVKGFLDLLTVKFLTSFGRRPQHLLGSIGLMSFCLGMFGMIYLAITWVIRYFNPDSSLEPLHSRALLPYSLGALLLGAQFLCMGILAEMITANQTKDEDAYSIKDEIRKHSKPE